MNKFALGQRWISDSESDLGLGTVVALEGRMLTLLFPASGETRLYSIQEAPLTRVLFNQGDTIRAAEGFELTVAEVQQKDDCLVYVGARTDTAEVVSLREMFLDHFISFSQPQDRLFAGQIDRFETFPLRYQSWSHLHRLQQSPLRGLSGGRMSLIPHQLHIANEVTSRFAPRVLLADEVGLGKTIEAGLIIHHQVLASLAKRVLVVVPESLQHQWLVEMLRRFNLKFAIFDEERYAEALADGGNPFETEQLVLTSLEFFCKKRNAHQHAVDADWDLLVVDEAHHLQWSEENVSTEYQRIEELAQDTPGLILLTATPDQLGHQSHFARLRLLDPNRFYDYAGFLAEEQSYKQIAELATAVQQQHPLSADTATALQQILTETDLSVELAELRQNADVTTTEQARHSILAKLLDRHGTGRVLFRNSRHNIQGFPQRLAKAVALPLPEQYQNALKVQRSFNTQQSLAQQAKASLFPERVFQEFEGKGSSWWQFDPRVDHLLALLKQHKREKFLLICAHADTAIALEEALRVREGIRAAVFHEGMSILDRDQAAAYFAQEDNSAQILLCSEIGSEGRNFQFAHHLVLFDLPLNPDLLEQRIGRLDRIGQQQDIQIHLPYFADQPQQWLYQWYQQGLDAFSQTCQTGRVVFEQVETRLLALLAGQQPASELAELLAESQALNSQLKQKLEQGRDKLLELNSSGGQQATALATQLAEQDSDVKLPMFMLKAWDVLGVNQDDRGENSLVLTMSEQLHSHYPMLDDDGISVTFDRATALAQEDLQFLSWDHPMVLGTLDILTNEQLGNSSVALLPNKALPAGTYFIELIYIVEASAPAELQLGRYLPTTPIRLLLEKTGKNLAANVPFEQFNKQLKPIGRQTASKLVKALQTLVHPLLQNGLQQAQAQVPALIEQASQTMNAQIGARIERLTALQRLNPSVRQDEIDHLQQQRQQLTEYIQKARLKLDALRVIVVSHE